MRKVNIQYFTGNEEVATMVFSGSKKSIILLGKLIISLANCQYDKTMIRALLGLSRNEPIQVMIKKARTSNGLQVLNKKKNLFGWGVPADQWKEFSYSLALLRSGKIKEHNVDEASFSKLELDITMGNPSLAA
jgi:hypothetical protein